MSLLDPKFFEALGHALPLTLILLSWTITILVSHGVGSAQASHRWKSNIKHHLPEVAREEISLYEEENKVLTKELESVKVELVRLKKLEKSIKVLIKED